MDKESVTPRLIIDTDEPLPNAEAIGHCLNYLQMEAARVGLTFASHLISVAAEAVNDSVSLTKRSIASPAPQHNGNGYSRAGGF